MKYPGHPEAEDPKVGDVWGYEGYGLEGCEDDYVFAVAICIDGGPLRVSAYTNPSEVPDDSRAKAFDKCLQSVESTWLSTVPDIFEPDKNYRPGLYSGGRRFLASAVRS